VGHAPTTTGILLFLTVRYGGYCAFNLLLVGRGGDGGGASGGERERRWWGRGGQVVGHRQGREAVGAPLVEGRRCW
jgi:hypothetical protein